jgi:hypothetical protein
MHEYKPPGDGDCRWHDDSKNSHQDGAHAVILRIVLLQPHNGVSDRPSSAAF